MLRRFRLRREPTTVGRVVLSHQPDGLGERLNALLHAMRLARLLGVDFRFTWPMWLAKDPQHAIVAAEEMFTAEFLAAHLLDAVEAIEGFDGLTETNDDLPTLRSRLAAADRGLQTPARPLSTYIDAEAVPGITGSYAPEFDAVGFHPQILDAIRAARSVPLGEHAVGIHLRAGDLLYGRYRSRTHYWHKAVPAPVARELIRRHRDAGREVVVLGQHRELIGELCQSLGATDAATLPARCGLSRAGEAVFDLVLMSRCERIIAGHSGFAIQASSIAGRPVDYFADLFTPDELLQVTRADLAEHAVRYDPIQQEFAWWAAYRVVKDVVDDGTAVELLTAASAADPANPRSRLHLAAHHHARGRRELGDDVLVEALRADVTMTDRPTLASMLLFSLTGLRGYDCAEIHDDILAAADRGPGPASIYRAGARAREGDADGATRDALAFAEFAGSDPRLAGLERLGSAAEETLRWRRANAGKRKFEVTVLDDVTGQRRSDASNR